VSNRGVRFSSPAFADERGKAIDVASLFEFDAVIAFWRERNRGRSRRSLSTIDHRTGRKCPRTALAARRRGRYGPRMRWSRVGLVGVLGVFVGCGGEPEGAPDPAGSGIAAPAGTEDVGVARSDVASCTSYTASIADQLATGRVERFDTTFFIFTFTTYAAVGTGDYVGSSPTQVATLYPATNGFTTNAANCQASQCGDGILQYPAEACDGALWPAGDSTTTAPSCKQTSTQWGAGMLKCSASCTVDLSDCRATTCGDGIASGSEECDGQDFAASTACADDHNDGAFTGGTLKCKSDCTYDTSGCTSLCGNGKLDPGEDCDGSLRSADFTGKTCTDYAIPSHVAFPFGGAVDYAPGPLTCEKDCRIYPSDGSCKIPPGCYWVAITPSQLGLQCY